MKSSNKIAAVESATVTAAPALTNLHAALAEVAALEGEALAIAHRIAGFNDAASAAQPSQDRLRTLQAERSPLLGRVALGESDHSELDRLDADLETAEREARSAARAQEIAAAGSARLSLVHDGLQPKIAAARANLDSQHYAAAVEHATAKVAAAHSTAAAFVAAMADLQGCCEAANTYAAHMAQPLRPYVEGPLVQRRLELPTPSLPGVDREAWKFDTTAQVAAAKAAALAAINA